MEFDVELESIIKAYLAQFTGDDLIDAKADVLDALTLAMYDIANDVGDNDGKEA